MIGLLEFILAIGPLLGVVVVVAFLVLLAAGIRNVAYQLRDARWARLYEIDREELAERARVGMGASHPERITRSLAPLDEMYLGWLAEEMVLDLVTGQLVALADVVQP